LGVLYLHYGGDVRLNKKRKKQASSLVSEYRHERKMALQRKRRLEKKGFVFPDGVIPDIPKNITAGSVRRLKKLTPKKLQEMGSLKTEEGKSLTGASARLKYQQKYKAQRKATRKKRKKQKGIELRKIARETAKESGFPTTEKVIKTIETEEDLKTYLMDIEEFLANKERAEEDNVNDGFEELEEEPESLPWDDDFYPNESDLIYEEIIRILNDGFNRDACQVALDSLNEKIQKVGFNQTMQIINATSDDLLEAANVIAYSSDQEEVESSLSAFITVINGEPLTAEQAQEISKKLNSKRFENYYNTTYF
jgi:hypothetical protein